MRKINRREEKKRRRSLFSPSPSLSLSFLSAVSANFLYEFLEQGGNLTF